MRYTWWLVLSGFALVAGSLYILFPQELLRVSSRLNRTVTTLDDWLIRYRYLVAILLFILSYSASEVALLLLAS